ncbi:MAG: SgcJ/EcaC family oxidoreductase [Sphingosinicella sp.]|nr:SgcJ/EcaC family oxidoreductase [Sphingosinicella sp.]
MEQEGQVRQLHSDLIDAWNRRDANAMAALYSERGGQVGFDGTAIEGPPQIKAHLAPIFRDHPTAAFVVIVREVRPIGPGTVLLRAVAGMIPPGSDKILLARNVVQSLVCSLEDSVWKIELFQNTPAAFEGRPDECEKLTAELQAVADQG